MQNTRQKLAIIFVALCNLWLVFGCQGVRPGFAPTKDFALVKIVADQYPQFVDDGGYDGLAYGIKQSLKYLQMLPADRQMAFGADSYSADHLVRSLQHFLEIIRTNPTSELLNDAIRANYLVYQSVGSDLNGKVLFTGYYEPILLGSRVQTAEYRFPIHARPDDLVTVDLSLFKPELKGKKIIGRYTGQEVVPYHQRRAIINAHVLEGKARPLAWVKDQVALFFLHIQGSGQVYLDSGQTLHVHYHTANGQPYRSIGKRLIDTGKIPRADMSMQAISRYLLDHPQEVDDILNYNPSYVFFKLEQSGPLGALNVQLTPSRSIALDWRIFPLSALVFAETKVPVATASGKIQNWINFTRFVLAQDTGGAIRGPGRADLFWGNGPYAEIAAGHMQHVGKLYFFVLKP